MRVNRVEFEDAEAFRWSSGCRHGDKSMQCCKHTHVGTQALAIDLSGPRRSSLVQSFVGSGKRAR